MHAGERVTVELELDEKMQVQLKMQRGFSVTESLSGSCDTERPLTVHLKPTDSNSAGFRIEKNQTALHLLSV